MEPGLEAPASAANNPLLVCWFKLVWHNSSQKYARHLKSTPIRIHPIQGPPQGMVYFYVPFDTILDDITTTLDLSDIVVDSIAERVSNRIDVVSMEMMSDLAEDSLIDRADQISDSAASLSSLTTPQRLAVPTEPANLHRWFPVSIFQCSSSPPSEPKQ